VNSLLNNHDGTVWVAAPGEGIVSTYRFGTYAAGWGTSVSAPFVSGTAALLINVSAGVNQQTAAAAIANAQPISSTGVGNGRLDTYMAVQSWVTTTGQQREAEVGGAATSGFRLSGSHPADG